MSNGMVNYPPRAVTRNPFNPAFNWKQLGYSAAKHIYDNGRFGNGRSAFVNASQAARTARRYSPYPSPRRTPPLLPKRAAMKKGSTKNYRGMSGSSKIIGGRKKRSYKKRSRTKSRKYKRKSVGMTNGVVGRQETIQKVQDLNAVYIGHTDLPPNQALEFIGNAIVKQFWAKEGILVESGSTLGPSVPNLWRFTYFATPTATTPSAVDSGTNVANASFSTAFANLIITMRTLMDSSDNLIKWQTLSWLSTPTSSDYRFKHDANMVQSKINGSIRSMLTMQNSTPNASDTNSTDVNNANPLAVTKYYGSGTGTEMVVRAPALVGPPAYTSFIADPNRGNIAVVAKQQTGGHLDEPPSAKLFAGCKSGGKFTLQPGNIYKSTLYDRFSMSLSSYMNMMNGQSITTRQKIRKGKYEFFGFEKVVTTTVAGGLSNVPINVDYEIDHRFAFKFSIKTSQLTLPVNTPVVALPVLVA